MCLQCVHALLVKSIVALCLGCGLNSDWGAGHWSSPSENDWSVLDIDVTPKTVTEWRAVGRLEAPVADALTLTSRGLHCHSERESLTRQDFTTDNVALSSISNIRDGCDLSVVNVEHVVATNKADTASSGPSIRSRVANSPGLNKAGVGSNDSTVRDAIGDEVGLENGGRCVGHGSSNSSRL